MVRGHLIAGLAFAAMAANAMTAAGQVRPAPDGAATSRPRATVPPGTDPATDAAMPRSARGKGKMARSSMSKLMTRTTHDIMMPEPEPEPEPAVTPPARPPRG